MHYSNRPSYRAPQQDKVKVAVLADSLRQEDESTRSWQDMAIALTMIAAALTLLSHIA